MMVFAGDTIKYLRIYHNGNFTDVPIVKIDSITHSEDDANGVPQPHITSTIVWTTDNQYKFSIDDIISAEVVVKDLEGEELYDEVSNTINYYLSTHEGVTIENIQTQLNLYNSVTIEIKNDILYIRIDGSEDIICDPYRKTIVSKSEDDVEDVNIDRIQEEINKALYPENDNSRVINYQSPSLINGLTRSENNNRSVLSRGEILLWDPWQLIKKIPSINGLKVTHLKGSEATLTKMKYFKNYDIVFMCCHGTPDGDIIMPVIDKCHIFIGCGKDVIKGRRVDKKELENRLPTDMSKMILWTSICWGFNSHLKQLAWERNVVAFAGCDNKSVNTVPEYSFDNFLLKFYSGATVLDAAASSFPVELYPTKNSLEFKYPNIIKGNKVSTKYHGFKDIVGGEEIYVSGNFILHCNNSEVTGKVLNVSMSPINNRPCASLTVPYKWYQSSVAAREHIITRSSYDSGVKYGLWLKNKETGKETEIEFDQSSEMPYRRYDYDKIISRIELLGNTKDLIAGKYKYRTYLEIDGKKTYSKEEYDFTKESELCPDNNHPHMIDMGLPSGKKWACCNVGANSPEERGGYYAWGETEEKSVYDWETYLYGSYVYPHADLIDIGSDISGTSYDVAYVKWGKSWRMPTKDEYGELYGYTTVKGYSYNGVPGFLLEANNGGGMLFFPAAGYRSNIVSDYILNDDMCFYWTSTLYNRNLEYPWYYDGRETSYYSMWRPDGLSVRAISK